MIAADNQAPTITLPGGAINYTEGNGPVVIDATATATDADSADLDGGTLTVDFTAGSTANDRLAIRNDGTGVGQIGVSGSDVTYNFGAGAVTIGSFSGGTDGSTPLVVTFNASATPVAVQATMRKHQLREHLGESRHGCPYRRFVLADGDGGTSTAETRPSTSHAAETPPTNNVPASTVGGRGPDAHVQCHEWQSHLDQ